MGSLQNNWKKPQPLERADKGGPAYMPRATVIGPTSWGTTLAIILAKNRVQTSLLARTEAEAASLQAQRENSRFLPGVPFPDGLTCTHDYGEALADADMLVLAVPSNSFRENVRRVSGAIGRSPIVVSASKGLEMDTGKPMSQVLREELPDGMANRIAVLSGPNLAKEIALDKPASTVIASADENIAAEAQAMFMSPSFRVYVNDDITGVELGGALKNIIALGAGICEGLGAGDNSKAAFMTRGLAEITRLGTAAGANPATFAGLAGVGDLMATCASPLSRNHYVGVQLAAGNRLQDILDRMDNVAEGVYTTVAALKMADSLDVEMPITQATYRILYEGLDPHRAAAELMGRPPRSELERT